MVRRCEVCRLHMSDKIVISEEIRFHRFPTDRPDVCEQWLQVADNASLRQLDKKVLSNRYICSRHFRKKDYMGPRSRHLCRFSVPVVGTVPQDEPVSPIPMPPSANDCSLDAAYPEPLEEPTAVGLCRLCGLEKLDMVPIFSKEGSELLLQQKISNCLPLRVCESDGLPTSMCQDCITQLESFNRFLTSSCKTVLQLLTSFGSDPVWSEQRYFSRCVLLEDDDEDDRSIADKIPEQPTPSVNSSAVEDDHPYIRRDHTQTSTDEYEQSMSVEEEAADYDDELENIPDYKPPVMLKDLHSDFPGRTPKREIYVCMLCYKKVQGGNYPVVCSKVKNRRSYKCGQNWHVKGGGVPDQLSGVKLPIPTKGQDLTGLRFRAPTCKFCKEMFFSKLQLIQHQLTHREAKLFICESSGLTYPQNRKMIYYCDVCGETMKHMCNGPEEEKKLYRNSTHQSYSCEGCGKTFCNRLRY